LGRVLAVISGKGGTGKTSICAGIASCLAAEGMSVLAIDCDVGLRNLDISLGMTDLAVTSFTDVMEGFASLDNAPKHPDLVGLSLLTAPVTRAPEDIDRDLFRKLISDAREQFDWCLIDAPAGIGAGFRLATDFADEILVVATCHPASLRDAARAADLAELRGAKNIKLIVNRVSNRLFGRMDATVDDVMDSVALPLLGIVPEDANIAFAAAQSKPLILYTNRRAAIACLHLARRLAGKRVPLMRI